MITPKQFAIRHLYPFKDNNGELVALYCPYCSGGSKKDKYTFALNTEKETFNCLRGKCGKKGTFNQLCKDFNEDISVDRDIDIQPKYVEQKKEWKDTSSNVEKYLKLRGISKETLNRRKVGEKDGNIVFPYYENGNLVLIKYRKAEKYNGNGMKSWREKGGKAVFWGMDDCDTKLPLVIVEGEMDALALDECGIKNVVSVPSGANDLNCITNCWEWMQGFKKIILWGDNDVAGQELVKKLLLRLDEWQCFIVESKHKDANIHLHKEGKESVLNVINTAKEVPIKDIERLSAVETLDPSKMEIAKSGIWGLDTQIKGFMMGQVSIWTGENASGKSVLLHQIMIESIEQGKLACLYSGELVPGLLRYWIELNMAGEKYIINKNDSTYVSFEIKELMRKWYEDKIFIYNSTGSSQGEYILDQFSKAVKRYNCKTFLIDNLMTISFPSSRDGYYRQQSEFVAKVIEFTHKYNVHVHIVAHPRKTDGTITKMDVGGSGDITNRVDNVFLVERVEDESYNTKLTIFKNRFSGKQGIIIGMKYQDISKRFYGTCDDVDKKYGWIKKEIQLEEIDKCPF
jgi:twinkle protein